MVLPDAREVDVRTKRFRGLLILPLVVALAGACRTSKSGAVASSENSRAVAVRTTAGNAPGAAATPKFSPAGAGSKLYTDPDDAFAVSVPADWLVEREEQDGAHMTVIRPAQQSAANLSIMTIKGAPPEMDSEEMRSSMLSHSSEVVFRGWLEGLKEQARVEGSGDVIPTRLDNVSALRTDVTYYRGDADDPRRGRAIYLIGDNTTFFVSLTASSRLFSELEEIVSTLRIEP